MARTTRIFALALLAVGLLNLAGCQPTTPSPIPTQAILDMEQSVFDQINAERATAGLDELVMDEAIRKAARAHSADMVARGFFDHVNPDGHGPAWRLDHAGIVYVSAGENIAFTNSPTPGDTAVTGWMASPLHRDNILRPQYDRTGLGVATDGAGGFYFTQDFIGTTAKSGEEPVFDYSEPLAIIE